MKSRELITQLTPIHGASEARAIVRMVMEECFHLSHTDLLLGKDTDLSVYERKEFEKIAQRLLRGEPVQYVLGYTTFCGHRFRVTPDVLIPRPETEELVTWAAQTASDEMHNAPRNILDLCTGSGCIAVSLALAFPAAQVTGVDISSEALAVASSNATNLGAENVSFLQQDILDYEASDSPDSPFVTPRFSLILSNPPYVCQHEATTMTSTVLDHEPHLALFVPDDDPLLFYRAIARIGRQALTTDGAILVEINCAMADATREVFIAAGFADVEVRNDQFGRPRMLRAKR